VEYRSRAPSGLDLRRFVTPHFAIEPEIRLCAAALAGDPDALRTLADAPEHRTLIASNRIAPGLAIRASELGISGPEVDIWRDHMRASAAQRLQIEHAREELGAIFAEHGIRWAPLKGMGFGEEIYRRAEERVSTDLDVMIALDDMERAVASLTNSDWKNLITTDHQRSFVLDEGYNWKLSSPNGVFLELHYRLWGAVAESFASSAFERTEPAPDLGPGAAWVSLVDAFIIAAVHAWQTPAPRYLALWWDLDRIARAMDEQNVSEVIERTTDHGLDLFVTLSASTAADLWGHPVNHTITKETAQSLRFSERRAAKTVCNRSPRSASLGVLTLGRLLANRPSRTGWRAVPRRIWSHPGVVEFDTPRTWSRLRRRLTHLARNLRLTKK
jgi:hypothetical protein